MYLGAESEQLDAAFSTWWCMKLDWWLVGSRSTIVSRFNSLSKDGVFLSTKTTWGLHHWLLVIVTLVLLLLGWLPVVGTLRSSSIHGLRLWLLLVELILLSESSKVCMVHVLLLEHSWGRHLTTSTAMAHLINSIAVASTDREAAFSTRRSVHFHWRTIISRTRILLVLLLLLLITLWLHVLVEMTKSVLRRDQVINGTLILLFELRLVLIHLALVDLRLWLLLIHLLRLLLLFGLTDHPTTILCLLGFPVGVVVPPSERKVRVSTYIKLTMLYDYLVRCGS